jgi:hypothetical protein
MRLFASLMTSVREINRKYAKPEIEMTLFTKICLVSLRFYLLGMVGLMVYALIVAAAGGTNPSQQTPETAPATQPAAPANTTLASTSAPATTTAASRSQP